MLARKNGYGTVSELVKENNNDNEASVEKGLSTPVQQPLPLAFINGEALIEKPEDLFIPPDALEVILETFEGPLDLLLYLIRKQKLLKGRRIARAMSHNYWRVFRQINHGSGLLTNVTTVNNKPYLLFQVVANDIRV